MTQPLRLNQNRFVSMGMLMGAECKPITDDAIYRDGDGTEHVVEWPTQQLLNTPAAGRTVSAADQSATTGAGDSEGM